MNLRLLFLSLIVCLSGCSTTKEMRKSNRCAKKLERLVAKCPEIARTDTIRDTLTVQVPAVVHDTVVLKADTIEISKDRWHVKIVTIKDSVMVSGGCDTDTLYVPVEVPCDTIQATKYKRIPLAWWQTALMFLGAVLIVVVIFRVLK